MNLIQHFGSDLAQRLQMENKQGAVCGFILIGLKNKFGDQGAKNITPENMITVFKEFLPEKLKILNTELLDPAIKASIREIQKNRSLFTMADI